MALTPREFNYVSAEELGGSNAYRRFCAAAGLEPVPGGYGLLLVEDGQGQRWTWCTPDREYLGWLVEQADGPHGMPDVPSFKFPGQVPGWPDEWPQPQAGGSGISHRSKAAARKRRGPKGPKR
jgi:hypothetical protein